MVSRQEGVFEKIRASIVNFDVEGMKSASMVAIEMGVPPEKIIEVMGNGMNAVGKRYEDGEYFVPELIMAGETMKEGLALLEPYITGESQAAHGTVVVATVLGDLHDIGKNIFITLLSTAGFKVVDLGVDVPPKRIVKAVKDSGADIVGLSALLTTNLEQIPIVTEELGKAGLRERVKVIIGGATVTDTFAREIGADGYAKDAVTGVKICKQWANEG